MLKILINFRRFSNVKQKIKRQRETRLGKSISQTILPTKTIQAIEKIRNIGIIAHIDAGKTTTTERMLYYAGALPSPGQIDQGTTTMDYMKQQRQRGITIRSAAISFAWKNCQVNLIDTPGHVDFSGEVARSLKVLDGAVTIVDGVKGVEAQTIKVWDYATKKNIPKICYINKLDRIGASVLQTAQSIKRRLKVEPLLMQAPIGQADLFKGVIDLVDMYEINFGGKYGQEVQKARVTKDHPRFLELKKMRENIVEKIGNFDEQIGEMYLNEQEVPGLKLKLALRKILSSNKMHQICPIFFGTSFKNKGVQPLLDAVVDYLPSPKQRDSVINIEDEQQKRQPNKNQPLSAYVFKIIYDAQKGPLSYTRIYSGEMKKNTNLQNSTNNSPQKINYIYRVRANQYVSIAQISAGDIVAISGLKNTKAGDTLIENGSKRFVLQKLDLPSAVFTVPFEVLSNKNLNQFKQAIQKAVLQDNSLHYTFQQQTGQYLMSGLGQLHLQILRDKLIQDKIPVKMGNLKINYKQSVGGTAKNKLKINKQLKPGVFQQFQIEIEINPLRNEDDQIQQKNRIQFTFDRVKQFDENWRQFLRRKQHSLRIKTKDGMGQDQTQQNFVKFSKKSVRNPQPVEAFEQEEDQDDDSKYRDLSKDDDDSQDQDDQKAVKEEQPFYHINTLPFQTLYELYECCRISLMYGKKGFPMTGVEIKIQNGLYRKSSFSKSVMNRCTTQLLRELINSSSVMLEPVLQFNLSGEAVMIDYAIKDVLNKRGSIDNQSDTEISGKIPAQSVRGWVKQLRAMGLQIDLKFSQYVQVRGIDPNKLIQSNN